MAEEKKSLSVKTIPALALRGMVAFPNVTMHFDVKREKSILAIKAAMELNKELFVVTQSSIEEEDPCQKELYNVGVVCEIKQLLRVDDNSLRILIEGKYKAHLVNIIDNKPFLLANIKNCGRYRHKKITSEQKGALIRFVKAMFKNYCYKLPNVPREIIAHVLDKDDPEELFTAIVPNLLCGYEEKQKLLEYTNIHTALENLGQLLERECTLLEIEHNILEKVKKKMDKNQHDYFLREQLHVIEDELGEGDSLQDEAYEFVNKIEKIKNISDESREKLLRECDRLNHMPAMSQEASVIHSYLDTVLELPWDVSTKDTLNIKKASAQLDRDHYGLKKVKERILELLSVRELAPDIKGQIICFVGPPGVGKTSIASSIAKAMNRKYVRVSLGGIYDESEIRGHRKTYLGSMPGRIINAFRQAKSNNPLILLDEIDKLNSDFRGDPASAMLEVLDSEQNNSFVDHYIDIPFDLSRALFITTANNAQEIPSPLLDRMEIIELSSYTREEKFNIAKRHLVKKQRRKHGLTAKQLTFKNSALYEIIDCYTREAGVRSLERNIGAVCRKAVKKIVSKETVKVVAADGNIEELLGPIKYKRTPPKAENHIGIVNGLAWTSVGGEMLEIECAVMPGTGKVKLTGSLGDVMKESADIAISYVRTIASEYKIPNDFYKTHDIHIHAPEGAVPKDGPSAGVTMVTALVSALTGIPVRGDIAMTGEISLLGKVMPIGGLKEKSMAAYREQKKLVIIPKENEPDLKELDQVVLDNVSFLPVEHISDVLDAALLKRSKDIASDMIPMGAWHVAPPDKQPVATYVRD